MNNQLYNFMNSELYLIQVAELRRGIAETLETCFMLTRLEGVDVRDLVMGATMEECGFCRYLGNRELSKHE